MTRCATRVRSGRAEPRKAQARSQKTSSESVREERTRRRRRARAGWRSSKARSARSSGAVSAPGADPVTTTIGTADRSNRWFDALTRYPAATAAGYRCLDRSRTSPTPATQRRRSWVRLPTRVRSWPPLTGRSGPRWASGQVAVASFASAVGVSYRLAANPLAAPAVPVVAGLHRADPAAATRTIRADAPRGCVAGVALGWRVRARDVLLAAAEPHRVPARNSRGARPAVAGLGGAGLVGATRAVDRTAAGAGHNRAPGRGRAGRVRDLLGQARRTVGATRHQPMERATGARIGRARRAVADRRLHRPDQPGAPARCLHP